MRDGCPFCDYEGPSPVLLDHEAGPFGEGVPYIVIEPLKPVVHGHLLLIPRKHIESATANPWVAGVMFEAAAEHALLLGLGDVNLITSVGPAATQSIRHLHIHIVPRRPGDRLPLPWDKNPGVVASVVPHPGDERRDPRD